MGRIREAGPRRWAALATAVAACAIPIAGCGGGGDDSATTATGAAADVPTVTAPATPTAPAPSNRPGGGAAETTAPTESPFRGPRAKQTRRQLAPFIACLSRHGVDSDAFRQALQQQYQEGRPGHPNLGQFRSQIEAGIACIPSLPPRLRASAQRLAQRYERRNG